MYNSFSFTVTASLGPENRATCAISIIDHGEISDSSDTETGSRLAECISYYSNLKYLGKFILLFLTELIMILPSLH